MPVRKYFIAIVPPAGLSEKVMAVKQHVAHTYHSRGALRSPAHITLHMPFEYEEEKEDKLIKSLADFRFGNEVPVALLNYGCFEPRVIFIDVLKSAVLLELQQELVQHVKVNLHLYNQAGSMRGFHPHITVAFRDLKKPAFYQAWEAFKNEAFSAQFDCDQLALLRSEDGFWKVHTSFNFTK